MKRVVFLIVLIVSVFSIRNLSINIVELWRKHDLLALAKRELEQEKQKQERLKKELARVESEAFVEEQARNKLFLVKEGESELVVTKAPSATSSAQSPPRPQKPTWIQWWELFF